MTSEPINPKLEPFVDADRAAEFSALTRKMLLELVRRKIVRGYPIGTGGKRHHWKFKLSELEEDLKRLASHDNLESAASRKVN
jgi:hypothetical protein